MNDILNAMNYMDAKQQFIQAYQQVRNQTELLCQPLMTEDYVIQSMADVSPPKWHLAHTTWFFETFILMLQQQDYQLFHPSFHHLFNSYYQAFGHPFPRIKRGLLARPTVDIIYQYRKYVDEHMVHHIKQLPEERIKQFNLILTLGLNHEQQHQELILMDIKYNFSVDPNFPIYHSIEPPHHPITSRSSDWIEVEGNIIEIGHQGNEFCFDNELPRHKILLKPYSVAAKLVTNGEYLEFIEAGGYKKPEYWLSDGWDCVQQNQWKAPLYWHDSDNEWHIFTLHGLHPVNLDEPVVHVSYYEADAYARWRNVRLPTEAEWEHIAAGYPLQALGSNFLEDNIFHPCSVNSNNSYQLLGDVWEWTSSAYSPYPGYKPLMGALGEYNGKFMSNQMVLRGGCCATSRSHIRASYRNFFQPDKRWQFSGIRLADDKETVS